MKRRMFDGSIWSKHKFARLPYAARLLQLGLINLADDQGRMLAHPAYLRSQIFPYDEDVTIADIRQWLALIVANGTAVTYADEENEYIQLLNWWEYQTLQFASPSEHPRPDGWHDRIRYNAKGGAVLTCNWTTPQGATTSDTCDEDGNQLPHVPENPPRNTGGRPPKNPPKKPGGNPPRKPRTNPNKDQDHDQDYEESVAPLAATSTPQQEMFGAICEALGWDHHVISGKNRAQIGQAVTVLKSAGYTVEDIRRFMTEIWFKDWRWEKNQQYPTLSILREDIGKLRSMIPSVAPPAKAKGMNGFRSMLAEQGIEI